MTDLPSVVNDSLKRFLPSLIENPAGLQRAGGALLGSIQASSLPSREEETMKMPYLLDTVLVFTTKRLAIASLVAPLLLFCFGASAQEITPSYRLTALDPTPCFSQILQDKRVSFTHDEFKLAMLSQWNYETYDSLKASGKLEAVVEDIPVVRATTKQRSR